MLKLRLLPTYEELPYELLLLADETVEAIDQYVHQSDVYTAEMDDETISVVCLYQVDAHTVEIKNMAIAEGYQGRGYGSLLLDSIKDMVRKEYATLMVGTADAGIRQIAFYEKKWI